MIDPASTVLAFTHDPDVFPELPDRFALTIAGHTHGGQVYLPDIGRPIVPSRFGERSASDDPAAIGLVGIDGSGRRWRR